MLFSVAYNVTTRAAFSKLRKEEEIFVPLVQGIIQVGAGFNIGDLFPSIKLLPWISGMRSRMERLHQEADILESIIKEHRARKAEGNSSNENKADDLVDVLLDLQEHGNLDFSLTTDNIKAVILTTCIHLANDFLVQNLLALGRIQVGARFNIGDLFPSIKLPPWISGMRSC
ncbi:hypothetical protein POTOM_002821 [Populus tomentosa]|uniref:Cytochrome P450 n=1 Tax=Populus tomentosa TaxID=118781 RepID=A0A8X8IXH6_POPTO|nr:hypothetical protein POTOM_002821 [Populus tomentosa]